MTSTKEEPLTVACLAQQAVREWFIIKPKLVAIDHILFHLMWGIECLLLIPFTLNFKKLGKSGKWIYIYLISSIFFAVCSFIIAYVTGNNMWFYNTMTFLQFVIKSLFFREIIKSRIFRNTTAIVLLPVLAIVLMDHFKWEGPTTYNSYATSIQTFILMVYSVVYFWQQLRDEELVQKSVFINSLPDFWYNAGLFVYHGSYFIFTLANNLAQALKGDIDAQTPASSLANSNLGLAITFIGGVIQLLLLYVGLRKEKRYKP